MSFTEALRVIVEITDYLNGEAASARLLPIGREMGDTSFKKACEGIFNWIQVQTRLKGGRPLACADTSDIFRLVGRLEELGFLFQTNGGQLDFNPSLPPAERAVIRDFVRDHLKPYFFISTRARR